MQKRTFSRGKIKLTINWKYQPNFVGKQSSNRTRICKVRKRNERMIRMRKKAMGKIDVKGVNTFASTAERLS